MHSFGMEAVKEMRTVMKQRTNARRLVFYPEQVTSVVCESAHLLFIHKCLNLLLFYPPTAG